MQQYAGFYYHYYSANMTEVCLEGWEIVKKRKFVLFFFQIRKFLTRMKMRTGRGGGEDYGRDLESRIIKREIGAVDRSLVGRRREQEVAVFRQGGF